MPLGTVWEPVCVLVTQSCPTLCDPMNYSLPGSSLHGILQARIPKWVAISFSRGSFRPRDRTQVSCVADSLPSELLGKPGALLYSYFLYLLQFYCFFCYSLSLVLWFLFLVPISFLFAQSLSPPSLHQAAAVSGATFEPLPASR